MKTEELIEELNDIRIDYSLSENQEYVVDEIIKRLKELEELKVKLKNVRMKDYVDQVLIDGLLKV